MSSDLRDRLEDLATHPPAASPPNNLWDRGVRRRRAERATAGLLVGAVVLLLGLGGWTLRADHDVQPADTRGSAHLPDRFYVPSPWLPAFDGPPGPLVAIGSATRKNLLHTREAVYGVTASTGRYGFLDLPPYAVAERELAESEAPILSPDGHQVAFWTTGTPSGSPNTNLVGVTVTGVAVYDTTTGQVRRTSIGTVHGLEPSTLQWLDDDTLVIGIVQASFGDSKEESCCSGHWQGLATWQVGSPDGASMLPRSLPSFIEDRQTSAAHGRILFSAGGHSVHEIDPQPPVDDRKLSLPEGTEYAVLSPHLRRVAYVTRRGLPSASLRVAPIPSPSASGSTRVVVSQPVPGSRRFERVVAWMDDRHVAVLSRIVIAHQVNFRLDRVDVRSGAVRTLVSPSTGAGGTSPEGVSLATRLLTAPSALAEAPPHPWDRRWMLGLSALGLVCIALVAWGFRVSRP